MCARRTRDGRKKVRKEKGYTYEEESKDQKIVQEQSRYIHISIYLSIYIYIYTLIYIYIHKCNRERYIYILDSTRRDAAFELTSPNIELEGCRCLA